MNVYETYTATNNFTFIYIKFTPMSSIPDCQEIPKLYSVLLIMKDIVKNSLV